MCLVRVVLLCKGRGAQASSYRPDRDNQFHARRDALVRCAAAFLHGPSSPHTRELVFLHDEDYARMEMRVPSNSSYVPSEHAILSLWKEAASSPTSSGRMDDGVTCRMVLDSSFQSAALPSKMGSKRQVLEYLQKHCSFDFLRAHGLNSTPNVILRKMNQEKLQSILKIWTTENTSSESRQDQLGRIFTTLLQPMNDSIQKVIAGTLHESSDSELPCFGLTNQKDHDSLQVCLFLGAVRDMHPWENRTLQACCTTARIPLVRIRLGPVSEFTSKILTVVACHHLQNVLGPAIFQLVEDKLKFSKIDAKGVVSKKKATMHVFLCLPIRSNELSSDLKQRTRTLWALVRVTVCTLWRSRLASNMDNNSPVHNVLTIVFQNAVSITLKQDELVTFLAEQHQAAPTEHQILEALCRKRDEVVSQPDLGDEWTKDHAEALVESALDAFEDDSLPTFALDVDMEATLDTKEGLLPVLYSQEASYDSGRLLVLLRVRGEACAGGGDVETLIREACSRRGIPVSHQSIMSSVPDQEAATVAILQHFMYQRRLLPALQCISSKVEDDSADKKRKRRRKKKSRKKGKQKKRRR